MDIRLKFVYPLKRYTAQKQWEEFPSRSWNKQSSWATKKFYIGVKLDDYKNHLLKLLACLIIYSRNLECDGWLVLRCSFSKNRLYHATVVSNMLRRGTGQTDNNKSTVLLQYALLYSTETELSEMGN